MQSRRENVVMPFLKSIKPNPTKTHFIMFNLLTCSSMEEVILAFPSSGGEDANFTQLFVTTQLVSLCFCNLIRRGEVTMKEGKSIAGYYCCCVCVFGSLRKCSCSVSLNLSDGHWEALFLFLKRRLTVEPKPQFVLQCRAACCFLPTSPRLGCDQFIFLRADIDYSE